MATKIQFKKLREEAIMPSRVTDGSAGYDALIPCDYAPVKGRQIIPLGFAIAMPKTLALDSRTRSGYAAKGILCYDNQGNEYRMDADVILGLIDSDYRNEVGIILNVHDAFAYPTKETIENTGSDWNMHINGVHFKRGQALAQFKFCVVPETEFEEVDELDETDRIGGFGKQNGE